MNLLLAFVPFIVFVVVERLAGIAPGLLAGALAAAVLLLRDLVMPGRSVKLLETGTFLLFGGLAVYARITDASWSIAEVRLRIDAGLTLIVLASIALKQPFSLQYARQDVAREHWSSPAFMHVNYVISAAWAIAFAVLVLADLVMAYVPIMPHSYGVAATVLALFAAAWFTGWYPEHGRPMTRT